MNNKKTGFTLMELLIVIAMIAVLATAVIYLINPMKQIQKSQDTRRKNDLGQLQKVLEDFYNDKNCYPKPAEVCYNPSATPITDGSFICNICGSDSHSPPFSYLSRLPCDPQHPTKKFLYQVNNNSCPSWYRIYTKLSNDSDPVITSVGCQGNGCGSSATSPQYGFNYGVSSPNTSLEKASIFVCCTINLPSTCNRCDAYDSCLVDPGCRSTNEIYAEGTVTCNAVCQQ